MTDTTPPAVWVDGDPLMEAIASAVWERCDTSGGNSIVTDDPRNIAAVAASVARAHATVPSAPADRAAIYREVAERLERKAAALTAGVHDLAWFVAKARLAEAELLDREAAELRRMADEAQQPSSTAPLAAGLPLVQGRCPACNGASLFLGDGGYVTCSRIDCPEPDAASTALEQSAVGAQQPETQREWCKCPSCWGWFVEEHPGEDLDELGKDLGWWAGLPEHRDAPAVEARQADTAGEQQ